MEKISDVVGYINQKLDLNSMKDISVNGLQVEGKDSVERILFAVDSGMLPFEKAKDLNADMVVVHHGLFWKYGNPSISGIMRKRVKFLLDNSISLYAAHLPLDMHPKLGNNISLIKATGAKAQPEQLAGFYGMFGQLPNVANIDFVVDSVLKATGTDKFNLLDFGSNSISKIAVMSGSSSYSDIETAAQNGADIFITGEEIDIYHTARDYGINVLFLGHHASETLGIKSLGKNISENLSVETYFEDIKTGL